MNLLGGFSRQPRGWIFAEMLVVLGIIGFLDTITGYEVRLLPFYAAPTFVVAWFCGKRLGILFGLLAGATSLAADWVTHDPDLLGWTRGWEITRHLASCLAVALVTFALRAKSDMTATRIALLEHSHRLEHEIVKISDIERQRIGEDLHDGLCQYLAGLACAATSLRDDLENLKLQSEADAASKLARLLEDAVVQARDLAHELVPLHLAQVGLVLALESLTQTVSQLHGIACNFEFHGTSRKFGDMESRHLYRIVQEAVNNAIRHGKAQSILVSLHADHRVTQLQIVDDGLGFSPDATSSGMGLNIMHYRARQAGGELIIGHPQSGGTLVSCTAIKNKNDKINEAAAA